MKILLIAKSLKVYEALKEQIQEIPGKRLLAVGRNTAEERLKDNSDCETVVILPPILGDLSEVVAFIHEKYPSLPVIVLDNTLVPEMAERFNESVRFLPPGDTKSLIQALQN